MSAAEWRSASSGVCTLVRGASVDQESCGRLLQKLNNFIYPLDGVAASEVQGFVCDVARSSTVHSPHSVAQLAQLSFSLLQSTQQSSLPQHVADQLFAFFSGWLKAAVPATELLYLLAMLRPSHEIPQAVCSLVAAMAVESSAVLEVRRAALHYLTVLCDRQCAAVGELTASLQPISVQLLQSAQLLSGSTAVTKLALSQLRAVCGLVELAGEAFLQPLLPTLLAALKFYMTTGLPGQPSCTAPLPQAFIPTVPKQKKDKRCTTIAGPQPPHRQPRSRPSRPAKFPARPPPAPSTSDSEVSDSEQPDMVSSKALACRLRHQALVCLAALFLAIGPRNTFSYWLSFLPDGPRLPHSPPSLLSCAIRDPNHKCRSAALAVLCAMLEGCRPYLAAADDRLQSCGLAFTPFSSRLGGILRELHHRLLLAVGTEAQPVVLTRAVRCLAILASNTPYHQLSSGYTSRILSALQTLSQHKDIDVCVACLTCCGAVLSTSPALPEVSAWLSAPQPPWLVARCSSLLLPATTPTPAAVQTEALQVLTAASKFYFPALRGHWAEVVELCLGCLGSPLQQQHGLKLLEELCRASAEMPEALQMWPRLLGGPLTSFLQTPLSPSLCAQACAVLATLSPTGMQQLQPSVRMLALTLPLGLSRDDAASPAVCSSAIRVLGVYCTFPFLREDEAFLQDSGAAILHALASSSQSVRVQASWALGNLTDALFSPPHLASGGRSEPSHAQLLSAAAAALKDRDVVKCNAVRAIGNLLRALPHTGDHDVQAVCSQLVLCISSGTMKLRWNACYACHNIFSSGSFPNTHCSATEQLLEALCEASCTCPNFKVRTHASLALGSLPSYTPGQLRHVWAAILSSLEHGQQHEDFAEFRQATNLRAQLCRTLCHVLCVAKEEDMAALPPHPLSVAATACLTDCCYSTSKADGTAMEAAEKRLSSCPAAVLASPTLSAILAILQAALDKIHLTASH